MAKSSIGTMTEDDRRFISITFGFTLGFGMLTFWEAMKQSLRTRHPARSIYVYMVWGEFLANTVMAIISYLLFTHHIKIQLGILIVQLSMWTLQIQLLPQIIINRISVIMGDRRQSTTLKWSVAGIIAIINVSVFIIWIPAVLVVNDTFVTVNYYWDRIEKAIYLVIDIALNYYFIRKVKQRLVNQGSTKYNKLVTFNIRIIVISLAMDVFILASMQLKHTLLYSQLHPLAFMVKLRIELSMASLIRRIASEKNEFVGTYSGSHSNPLSRVTNKNSTQLSELRSGRNHVTAVHEAPSENDGKLRAPGMDNGIVVRKQVIVETMRDGEGPDEVVVAMGGTHTRRSSAGTDQRPLTNNAAAKGEGW